MSDKKLTPEMLEKLNANSLLMQKDGRSKEEIQAMGKEFFNRFAVEDVAKTDAVVEEGATIPADTVLASDSGLLESISNDTLNFDGNYDYLPSISDIKEDTEVTKESDNKKPSIKDPFSYEPISMGSEVRGPGIEAQIEIDKTKSDHINYMSKVNPIVLPSIDESKVSISDLNEKIKDKAKDFDKNNFFLGTQGLDQPTIKAYKESNKSLRYDILNLQLVKAQKEINNNSFKYGSFSKIKANYIDLYTSAIPENVELLENAEQAYSNIEGHIKKGIDLFIQDLNINELTKIDFNGSERADIGKVKEQVEKFVYEKTGGKAYQNPVLSYMAYESIRNRAEQNGIINSTNKIISENSEAQALKEKIGGDQSKAFIKGSEIYKIESVNYNKNISKLNNEFISRQEELHSELKSLSKQKFDKLKIRISNGSISNEEANNELKAYNAAAFNNIQAKESKLLDIYTKKEKFLINNFNKIISSQQEEFNKTYKIPTEDQELLSSFYNNAWAEASDNENSRLKDEEEGYSDELLSDSESVFSLIIRQGLPNIGKEMNGSISRAISSFGVMSNNNSFIEIGDAMKSNFSISEDKLNDFSDLLDFSKVTKAVGRGLGSALPSIAAGATVSVLSGGIGTIPAMAMVASAGWISETSDMAGTMYRDTYAETGSLLKAQKASDEIINAQLKNFYLYTLDGLPFVGKSLKYIPTKIGRVSVAGGVESITETGQETVQTAQEETISESVRSGGEITSSGWRYKINSGMIKSTALEVIPSSLVMGSGGRAATEYKDSRNKNKFIEGIINKYKLSTVDENDSFITQKIYESTFKHGGNFTTSWLSTLLDTKKITEEEFSSFSRSVNNAKLLQKDNAFFSKLNKEDKRIYQFLSNNVSVLKQKYDMATTDKILSAVPAEKAKSELKEFVKDPSLWSGSYVDISINGDRALMNPDQLSTLMSSHPEMFINSSNVLVTIYNNPELSNRFKELLNPNKTDGKTKTEAETTEQPATDVPSDGQNNGKKVGEVDNEISDYIAESASRMSVEIKVGELETKIDNAEYINEDDILEAQDKLIGELDRVENSDYSENAKATITSELNELYNKLDNYEFRTETKTKEYSQKRATRNPIENKREQGKSPQERIKGIEIEVSEGDDRTVIEESDGGLVVQSFDDKGNRTESIKLDAKTMDDFELSKTIKDNNGVVVGAVLQNKNNNNETFTISDQDIAYDLAIDKTKAELGKVTIEEQVVATEQVQKKKGIPETKTQETSVKEKTDGVTAEVQEEVDAMEADENLDMSGFDNARFSVAEEGGELLVLSESTDVEAIADDMVELLPDQVDYTAPQGNQVNVDPMEESNSSEEFTDEDAKKLGFESKEEMTKPIEYFNGMPMVFGVSDVLAGGTIKDAVGKAMKVAGGLMFNALSKFKAAWAGVKLSKSQEQVDAAVKVYKDNKALFERLWEEGKLPYGHVPMAITRMGDDAVHSNEAVFRYLAPEVKSQPIENQTAALNDIVAALEKSETPQKKKILAFIKKEKVSTFGELLDAVISDANKRAKAKSKADLESTLTLDIRTLFFSLITTDSKKEPQSGFLNSLYKGSENNNYSLFIPGNIRKAIAEPSMLKSKKGDIVSIVGVDVLNPGVVDIDHPNYGTGPRGRLIALISNPVNGTNIFPTWRAKSSRVNKPTTKGKIPDAAKILKETMGTAPSDVAFRGDSPVANMTDLDILIGKLKFAFPGVAVIKTKQEFEKALSEPGVRTRITKGKVILGMTKDGKVFLNPDLDSLNTPIHEFGHIWIDYLRSKLSGDKGTALLQRALKLVEGTKELKAAIEEYGDNKLAREEALVAMMANKGETLIGAAKSRFKEWMNAVFKYIQSKLVLSEDLFQTENIKALNAERKELKGKKVLTKKDKARVDKIGSEIEKIESSVFKDIKKLSIDEFLNTGLADLFKGKPVNSRFDAAKESKGVKPRFELSDNIDNFINQARGLKYSEAAIEAILKKKGVDSSIIASALSDKSKQEVKKIKEKATSIASETQGLSVTERFKQGFAEFVDAVKNDKRKAREVSAQKLRDEIKSSRLSIKELNERRKELSSKVSELKKNGKISTNQARVIINKIGSVNLYNVKSVDSFLNYMEKVYNNADYADRVMNANSLKNNIKRLSKSKNLDPVLARLGESFQKISIRLVGDIDEYTKIAESVKEGLSSSRIKGTDINWTSAVSVKETEKYIGTQIKKQEVVILENKRQEFQDITGIDASELSYNEMMSILNDAKEKTIDKTKEKLIRDNIQKVFDSYKAIINKIISTGKNPFSLSEEELSLPNKSIIKRFMDMKISDMKIRDAIKAVDALNNYMVNGLTSGMEGIVSVYEGGKNTKALVKKGIKAKPLKLFGSKAVGRISGQEITTLPLLLERMFKSQDIALKVMRDIGIDGIVTGKSGAIKETALIIDSYLSKFDKKTPNGKAFNDASNIIERGMIGFARRTVMGVESAVEAEFIRRKNLIKESISVLKEGTAKEKKKSEEYQSVYDKILKDSKSIEDVDNKSDKINLAAVKWWGGKFSGYFSEMAGVSLNIYNDILDLSVNYNPDSYTSTEGIGIQKEEFEWSESAMSSAQSSLIQKKSGSLEAVTLPKTLNKNTYISLDFDTNNAAILKAALIDIRTAADIQVLKGALTSDYFKELVPTKEDRDVLESRLKGYVRNTRGKDLSLEKMNKELRDTINLIASLGVSRVLGGISQPLKQMGPVAVNTLINSGRLDLRAIFDVDFNKWLNQSGYSIANRGFASDTTLDSINRALEQQAKSKGRRAFLALEKVNKMWLETFLVKPDAAIARSSWQSYYKQSLKKQGLEYNGIDWKTHNINKVAGAYAEQQVNRQQNVSDPDLQGDFMTNKNPWLSVARKVLIPFQNFVLNQKQRMYSDVTILTSKTSSAQDKSAAARSLAGLAGEMTTYYGIRISITLLLFKAAAFMMGYSESDEEEEKRIKNTVKGSVTSISTDLFSPIPQTDIPIKMGLNKIIGLFQMDIPEKERFLLWNNTKKEYLEGLGILGMAAQGVLDLKELSEMAYTGKYTTEYMGNKTTKTIPPESQDVLKMILIPSAAYTIGYGPSEFGTMTRYIKKIAKKQGKTDKQLDSKKEETKKSNRGKTFEVNPNRGTGTGRGTSTGRSTDRGRGSW